MKIDIERATARLIFLCWITIFVCLILKFFGFKEFKIPIISQIEIHHIVKKIINCIFYCLNGLCFTLILVKRRLKLKEFILVMIINIILFIISMFSKLNVIRFILEFICYAFIGVLFIKDKWYKICIESTLILFIFSIYQIVTMLYKDINVEIKPVDLISNLVLDLDYYMLILLTIIREFKKGGYIYGRWLTFLAILSKPKSIKQLLSNYKTSIQQDKKKNDVGFKLFIIMLSICQIAIVGVSCYFINNVILEYFIIIISFFFMRQCFGKSYHADSVIKCTTLSIMTFVLSTRLSLPIYLTILCNIFIGCLVAYIMHIWYYYIKYTTNAGITICKGMTLENLLEIKNQYNLNEMEFDILNDYYVKKHKLDKIAITYSYSVDNIKKIKAKALKKIIKS